MKLIGVISTAVLSLTLAAPVYARQEQHDQQEEQKDKPAEKKAQPEKPAKPAEKNAQEEKNTKPEEKSAQEDKTAKPEEKNAQEDKNAKPAEKNTQQAGNRGRIPADKYKANFGQGHTFRVNQGDYNNHRFQYGGYSFGFVGAWPGNWLYTQNVYVIDIDGVYYLCNPMYPGVNIELSVAL
ncbi:MAG: hypothetical protein ABSA78_05015 [Candidatus Sulfotelmatobacter sp.]